MLVPEEEEIKKMAEVMSEKESIAAPPLIKQKRSWISKFEIWPTTTTKKAEKKIEEQGQLEEEEYHSVEVQI